MEAPSSDAPATAAGSLATRLQSVSLPCENCGQTTAHRVLRWDPRTTRSRTQLSGVARCQVCRWTHPFVQRAPATFEIAVVVSEGPRSTRQRLRVPAHRRIQVGSGLPGGHGELEIHRIDRRDGESVASALTNETATVWATRTDATAVPVSIVDRDRTVAARWVVSPATEVAVGETVEVDGLPLVVVGVRARGHTWKQAGDRFPARDVQRLYGRRREMPPAGRSDWRRVRLRPSSDASSASSASRSRSGPGTRTARTVPRTATAVVGAAVHILSPS